MLGEVCQYLHNWFDRGQPKWIGAITIREDGSLSIKGKMVEPKVGQYIRILGSTFNDGVYQYPVQDAVPEVFNGAVWAMAVPKDILALVKEIEAWQGLYGGVESTNMSPYTSESFGGYSYSKSGGGASTDGNGGTWQTVYATRLNMWRKLP